MCDYTPQVEGLKKRVSMAAIRALATLGENGEVGRAVGRPGPEGRGVRILSMDGGGMKVSLLTDSRKLFVLHPHVAEWSTSSSTDLIARAGTPLMLVPTNLIYFRNRSLSTQPLMQSCCSAIGC